MQLLPSLVATQLCPPLSLTLSVNYCNGKTKRMAPHRKISSLHCRLGLLSFLLPRALSLSVAPSSASPPIQRVAIIGTGIAGLSLAHALENSPELASMTPPGSTIEVSLFDSRPSFDFNAGAGVQLNGGMSVLRKINPKVQRAVADAALPMKAIRTRSRCWKEGDKEDFDTLLQFELEETVQKAGGKAAEELIVNGEVMFYAIMRGALQEAMLKTLPKAVSDRAQFGKTLTGIDSGENGGIQVSFLDGTSAGPFDMVIGCDGIKSAVKEYIQTGKIQKDAAKRQGAVYSGIRIRYAVQDGSDSTRGQDTSELRQYFGEGAYALTGTYGAGAGRPPAKSAFIISLDKDYFGQWLLKKPETRTSEKANENADWTQDVRTPASSRDVMLQQVKDCRIPTIDAVPTIENADRFFELGVYFHNPFSLSGWSKQVPGTNAFCTLSGDAAHAMPPFLGQGSNQAIQDAYSLAKKIYEHNARSLGTFTEAAVDSEKDKDKQVSLKTLLKEYEQVRWATTTSISAKAGFLGYLEASEGFPAKFRDVFFSTMFKTGIARNIFLGAAIPKV